jgi:putative FmdB family regulatory protein
MPTYDYVCKNCGIEVDITHDINETRHKCPTCGQLKLKRAWSQVAAFHSQYSPMAPRANRGIGNTGKRKKKA